jgi:hypothetical protein
MLSKVYSSAFAIKKFLSTQNSSSFQQKSILLEKLSIRALPAALVVAALQRQPLKTRPPWRTIFDVMMASRILHGFVRRELSTPYRFNARQKISVTVTLWLRTYKKTRGPTLAPLGPDNHTLGGVEQITTHT